MVTYFNRKDLVSFGSYLMSEKRKALKEEAYARDVEQGVNNPLTVQDRLQDIDRADVENWLEEQN